MSSLAYLGSAAHASLPPSVPKAAVEGSPMEAVREVWSRDDRSLRVGIWECTPGVFAAERREYDESVFILSGRGTLVSHDGIETEHGPGDLVVIPQGFSGFWRIHETLRKAYVVALSPSAVHSSPGLTT